MFKKVPHIVKLSGCSGGLFVSSKKEVVVNGVKRVEFFNADPNVVYPDLPDPENFSLDVQLSSGVPLQPVDCNLLSPSARSLACASQELESKLTENDNDE